MPIGPIGSQPIASASEEQQPSKTVAEVQKALNQIEGNPVVAESGIFDKQTEAALKAFQKSAGLEVGGVINQETVDALNKASYRTGQIEEEPSAEISTKEKGTRKLEASLPGQMMEASLRSKVAPEEKAFQFAPGVEPKVAPEEKAFQFAPGVETKVAPEEKAFQFAPGVETKVAPEEKAFQFAPGVEPKVAPEEKAFQFAPGVETKVAPEEKAFQFAPGVEPKAAPEEKEGPNKLTPDQVRLNEKGEIIIKKPE